ncbi:cysteine--tRNA ligase [Vulcaniibacterium thermophilum]|uniref:Cysteine--tRNA ligase n=2 Tax=Gammaproteobacteria TaxID=1236 RepID=A0A918Z939_9GAMM|nr:cysteine--tRNA ligase [Vulcaniibacterium thermophilum]GHE41819.1 cysteine--tRNA ligase [Vulcaniibacterium thermophilum]
MALHLYNSLTRRIEPFAPQDPGRPTMYVCGPTVYNYVHIGNARGPVVFGVLAALLRRRYGALVYARNITDVDDKINAAAAEAGVPISTITDRYAAAYREDMAALGVSGAFAPDVEPAATAHIAEMIAMIQRLIDQGHAYVEQGHVLFSVASFPEYGKLSRRDREEMLAGARVEVAPYKRDPGDFVLWKPSTDDLPGWDSPWGRGRPGWHIECSAMAARHLGQTIDIHAGGVDLQFPHHENEIAQSECAHGQRTFARFWLHNGMLTFGGAKMAKSVGNIQRVHDLVRAHPPEALRYALLSAHYRQPLDWSDALIEQSVRTLDRLYGTLRDLADVAVPAVSGADIPPAIDAALDDDLNTPAALAELSRIAADARKAERADDRARLKRELLAGGFALGLLQQDPAAWFARGAQDDDARIQALIDERAAAKKARDFARADAIREQLAGEGILLEDTPQGVRWRRA